MPSRPLRVLFAEPPPAQRAGGIETALRGLAGSLPGVGVEVQRSCELKPSLLHQVDVVHFHGLWQWPHHRARGWCRKIGKPFLVSPHGMLEDWAFKYRGWKKRPYFHCFERPSLRHGRVILATSVSETEPLLRWFPSRQIRVLPLGGNPPTSASTHVAAKTKLGLATEEHVLLFLSRCHEKKGLHLLIEALPRVAGATARPVHLLIVGDGDPSYVAPLQRATASWRGNLRATWTGAQWGDEKWDYLAAADLLCLPSYSENFGLAVLEALFVGTPVLTTYATPWPTLRGSLPISFSSPSVAELAPALQAHLTSSPPTEVQRAATRHEALAAFNWSTLAPRYAELYAEIAGAA